MVTRLGLNSRVWSLFAPRVREVFFAYGGIGDELMVTAITRAARRAGKPIGIVTDQAEIWRGNSDPLFISGNIERWLYASRRSWISTRVCHLTRSHGTGRHLAQQMADMVGVELPQGWRPVFPVSAAKRDKDLIVFQNSCRGAKYPTLTKEWPQEKWRDLIPRLTREFKLVQVGTPADPPVPCSQDLRGRTTLREIAQLLASARLFLGLEGGLMHVAAAVHTPAVVIYGGRTRPCETGYPFNRNITRSPPCAGCGLDHGCPHQLSCLDIPADEVEKVVRHALDFVFPPENHAIA